MSSNGWIKLHRSIFDNPVLRRDPKRLSVWLYLLTNATHTGVLAEFCGKTITLKPGQLITGRKSIAERCGVHESSVTRILQRFETEHMIEQQTSTKNRIITLVNWDKYQNPEQLNGQQVNIKRTSTEHQPNTNNKEKKVQNGYFIRSNSKNEGVKPNFGLIL